MIVVYAPYPSAHLVTNGWMRRIATIDRILGERERAYVFPADPVMAADWHDYRVHVHQVAPGATMRFLDFRFSLHHRRLTELVQAAEFVYAHTSHAAQHLLPYYATGKIVSDLHGIAPEEEDLQGKPWNASFFAGFEETMVRHSAALVSVTQAMVDHLRRKYPGMDTPTIRLPIVEDIDADGLRLRTERARPVVVYAGGLQRWQNVELMLRGVAACRDRCDFRFYTDQPDALRDLAHAHGVADALRIGTATPQELPAIYADADFGLVLRDDIAVNRVSCPTKLSEYLAAGVVPIVSLAEIGDFATLDYRRVTFDDLVAGRLPDHATATAMRLHNREVFTAIRGAFLTGERQLRDLRVKPTAQRLPLPSSLLTTLERTAFFPVRHAAIEVVRDAARYTIALDDIAQAQVELDVPLPGSGRVQTLRVIPGPVPFVTSPIEAEVIDDAGRKHGVAETGSYTIDPYGNWCFNERGAAVELQGVEGVAAERLRLRWEYLLVGPEALVAQRGNPGTRGWFARLRANVHRVPGAHSAWEALQRLRRR